MNSKEKRDFSQRLITAMRAVPVGRRPKTKHGVDVAALQRETGVTREMARRYLEGEAIPGPDRLRAIAEWLGVRFGWLRDGEGPMWPTGRLPTNGRCIDTRDITDPALRAKANRLIEAVVRGEVGSRKLEAVLTLLLPEEGVTEE